MPKKLALLAVTLAALAGGVYVWYAKLVEIELGGRALFLSEPAELALLWVLACVFAALLWRPRLRPTLLLMALLAGAVTLIVLVAETIRFSRPERVRLEKLEAAPAGGPRTLILGVDGFSWNRLLPLVASGKMPNVERLMRQGSYGVLHSHRTYRKSVDKSGYWSPVVWTSIATGVAVEKHGIDDFNIRGERRATLAASHHRKVPAFWNLFSAFGRSVGVVGWWASWPAEEVNGVMASSGLGLRGERGHRRSAAKAEEAGGLEALTYPPEFERVVEEEVRPPADTARFIDQTFFPMSSYPILAERERRTFESVVEQDRLYYLITRHLLEERELDLYATYLEGADLAGHLFWRYAEDPNLLYGVSVPAGFDEHAYLVERYYGLIDRWIGSLVKRAGKDATVIVCSDHGFRSDPEHVRKADHSGYGVLIVKGEGVRRGHNLNLTLGGSLADWARGPVSVLDVLPTLLYLHGLPISDELDGRVLYRALERSYMSRRPEVRVSTYGDFGRTRRVEVEVSEEAQREHLERLRSLGYID